MHHGGYVKNLNYLQVTLLNSNLFGRIWLELGFNLEYAVAGIQVKHQYILCSHYVVFSHLKLHNTLQIWPHKILEMQTRL